MSMSSEIPMNKPIFIVFMHKRTTSIQINHKPYKHLKTTLNILKKTFYERPICILENVFRELNLTFGKSFHIQI